MTVRVLSLDPGEKRVGVAISDALGITAQGLETINYLSLEQVLGEIKKVCAAYGVEKIIVGNPLNMNGTSGPASDKAAQLAERLREYLKLPVSMVDERLTSKIAESVLISGGYSRKKRRAKVDKIAAVLILETYLSRSGNLNNRLFNEEGE